MQWHGSDLLAWLTRRVVRNLLQLQGGRNVAPAQVRCDTLDEDLRTDQALAEAVAIVCAAHPKGGLLADAWQRALGQGVPGLRAAELGRVAATIRAGLGGRIPA